MKQNTLMMGLMIAIFGTSGAVMAGDCEITLDSDDQMQFDTDEITIDTSCDSIELTLVHSGELEVNAMGHNVVFTLADDYDSLAQDAMEASDTDYVPEGDDRVIAATDLIGGGESTTLEFDPGKFDTDEDYMFFCSFPGHAGPMSGDVVFTEG